MCQRELSSKSRPINKTTLSVGNWVLPILMLLSSQSHGLEYQFGVGYEGVYSTNPDLSSTDEVEQWVHIPSVDIGLAHEARQLQVDLDYRALRRTYQQEGDGRFEDENVVTGSALLAWQIVPERLTLEAENTRTETTINAIRGSGPQNRQEVQSSSVGVIYDQPTIGSQYLSLAAYARDYTYEETANDAEAQEVQISYSFPMDSSRAWGIQLSHEQTEFDTLSNIDYEASGGNVFFRSEAPNGRLMVEAGHTRLESEEPGRPDVSGFVGELEIERGISSGTRWGIALRREIGDRLAALDSGTPEAGTELDLFDTEVAEIFVSTSATANLQFQSETNQLVLELSAAQEDYEAGTLDREWQRFSVVFDRRARANLNMQFNVGVAREDFQDVDQEDDLLFGRAALIWQAARRLVITGAVSYEERDSSISSASYDEWRASLSARYVLLSN